MPTVDWDSYLGWIHDHMPDAVTERFLVSVFGPGAFIVVLFVLVNWLLAWHGTLTGGTRLLRQGTQVLGEVGAAALRIGWASSLVVLGIAVVTALAVMLWIGLSFLLGNGMSYMAFGHLPLSGPRLGPFLQWRRDDWVTRFHLWGALAVALHSVARALGRNRGLAMSRPSPLVFLLVAPWALLGVVMALYSFVFGLAGLWNWYHQHRFGYDLYGTWVNPLTYVVLAGTSWGYIKLSLRTSTMPARIVVALRRRSTAE